MKPTILIIDGHPDPCAERLVHALADAYRQGAEQARHEVRVVRLADLTFPLLRTQSEYEKGEPVEAVREVQHLMEWATHLVIVYPLWLGSMPAMLKALLEQTMRPGFAFSTKQLGRWRVKFMSGKSARIIVTMGMSGLLYRWYFRAHSLRSLQRNILRFVGYRHVRSTIIGSAGSMSRGEREDWLKNVRGLGQSAA